MPFEKGKSGNPAGRVKGSENVNKREFKVALKDMFENNADKIAGWLDEIAKEDPKEALNQLNRWAEYCYPKQARTEIVGDKDNPLALTQIDIINVKAKDRDTREDS